MMGVAWLVLWLVWSSSCPVESRDGRIREGVGQFLSAVWSAKDRILCQLKECCGLSPNLSLLEESLAESVFGQHLATSLVIRTIRARVKKSDPRKALVMSFHGWTGSGKNHVAKFVVESLLRKGMKSKFLHLFISPLHFPDNQKADIYKLQVQDWIRGNVTACDTSIFIFDEIDKMPEGMIDSIKPFINLYESVDGQNFRKSIFIFLSNTGGKEIARKTYSFWTDGRRREEISYSDLEPLVENGAFNELGGQFSFI